MGEWEWGVRSEIKIKDYKRKMVSGNIGMIGKEHASGTQRISTY